MSLVRKGIIAGGGSIICTFLGLLMNMILSRTLMPEGMGRYQVPYSSNILIATILGLGIGQANIYFLNKHQIPKKQIFSNSLFFGGFVSFLLIIGLPIIYKIFSGYFGILPLWTTIMLAVSCASVQFIALLRPILIAELHIRESVFSNLLVASSSLSIVFVLYLFNICTVELALAAVCVGQILSVFYIFTHIKKELKELCSFSLKIFKDTLRYGLKIFFANIVYLINAQIGIIILRFIMKDDFSPVGYYGRAAAICSLLMLIPKAIGPLLYAKWSGADEVARKTQVEFALRIHIALGVVAGLFLIVFAPLIIHILYGKEFMPAVNPLRILIIGVMCRCVFNVINNLLMGDGKAHIVGNIMFISVVAIIILSFFLIPIFGLAGMALADSISGIIILLIGIFIIIKNYKIRATNIFQLKINDLKILFSTIRKR